MQLPNYLTREIMTYDFFKVFTRVRIPLLITDSNLNLIYANASACETLPFELNLGERVEVDDFLRHEDSLDFENMVAECKMQGESVGTLKAEGIERYFRVRTYYMNGDENEERIIIQFEDITQSRILEDQMYEHLIDLYNQVEAQSREITELRARALRSE